MDLDLKGMNDQVRDILPGVLGIEITEMAKGRVVATMPVDGRHHQPYGLLHGGASLVLAETAASIGGWFLVAKENKLVVGQEINANHLKSVRSGTVEAVAEVIHQGKSSQVWEIKISHPDKGLICISRCTLAVIEPR